MEMIDDFYKLHNDIHDNEQDVKTAADRIEDFIECCNFDTPIVLQIGVFLRDRDYKVYEELIGR